MTTKSEMRWDYKMLVHAATISLSSKDPSTQVGAVITDGSHRIVSQGFNGFPQGIADDRRLHDREKKYQIVLHAEENAMIFAQRPLDGCTMYTFPMMPCIRCASKLIQSGIYRIVAPAIWPARWKDDLEASKELFAEAQVEMHFYLPAAIKTKLHSLELELAHLRGDTIDAIIQGVN